MDTEMDRALIEYGTTIKAQGWEAGFGDSHHDAIDAQIEVLKGRLDNDAIYDRYWGDPESGDEMPEDVLIAALDAMGWMDGGSYGDGVKPSESWKELLVS